MSGTTYASRPYRAGLFAAILLFLIMLTVSIVIVIIDNARADRQETEFSSTLTAVWNDSAATQTAVAEVTGSALGGEGFALPFALAPGSLTLHAGPTCDEQTVAGQILNQAGEPMPGGSLMIWGDGLPPATIDVAGSDAAAPGSWQVTFSGLEERHVWVQLMSGTTPLSPPVAIVFTPHDCELNHAELVFRQLAGLDATSP